MPEREVNKMDEVKKMSPEILKTAYRFGSECYWAMRAQGETMPQELLDRLIAIADELFRTEEQK